jgi:hypothetical protein
MAEYEAALSSFYPPVNLESLSILYVVTIIWMV